MAALRRQLRQTLNGAADITDQAKDVVERIPTSIERIETYAFVATAAITIIALATLFAVTMYTVRDAYE
jgi:hypothetical protein